VCLSQALSCAAEVISNKKHRNDVALKLSWTALIWSHCKVTEYKIEYERLSTSLSNDTGGSYS
jgi:hypothetical protein